MKSRTRRRRYRVCLPLVCCVAMMGCQSTSAPAQAVGDQAPPAAKASPQAATKPEAKPTAPANTAKPASKLDPESEPNAKGVTLAACRIVCQHVLHLALQEFPPEADEKVRQEHTEKLARECPPGCMREATIASNACALRAKTVAELVACQP